MDLVKGRLALHQISALAGVSEMTVRHWSQRGLIINGKQTHLRTFRVGRRIYTKREWWEEFREAMNSRELARA